MRKIIYILFLFLIGCSTESTPSYVLNVNVQPSEAGSVSPATGEYDEGEEVNVSATPNEHWVFDRWQGDHSGSENPVTVIMNSDKNITAQFIEREYPLTIETIGEGTVAEEIIQIKATDYPFGTTVQLTANPVDGWGFVGWEGDLEGNENPKTITINGEKTVTAVFEIQSVSVTVQAEGEGSVILNPDKEEYEPGEEVEVTAEAAEDWFFSHWEGDITGNENPINITVDNNKNISAIFEEAPNTKAVGSPQQGNVTLFQANNTPSGVIFVSTEEVAFDDGNNGIWRSGNSGQSWEKTANINVDFITIAANEPNLVFAGHDEGYLLSQDGGLTWDAGSIDDTFFGDPLSLNDASIVTANDGIFVATRDALGAGLYRSTNLGQSWQHILSSDDVSNTSDALLQYVETSPENTNVVYTSTSFDHNIWKFTNGGSSFSSIKSGITISPFVFSDGIVVNPSDSEEILIQGHISGDGGSTWNPQDVSPLENIWMDNTLIKVENDIVFGSQNLGDSWTEIVQLVGENLPTITNPHLFLSEDGLYLNTSNGIFKMDLSVIESKL